MPKTLTFDYEKALPTSDPTPELGMVNSVSKVEYELFKPSILDLGDISAEGEYVQALIAFLDLQGFTEFCNQVDAHLVIPLFLQRYIAWLFNELRSEFKEGEDEKRVYIWGTLPIFSKFLGDGILFIWDTTRGRGEGSGVLWNIVMNLNVICGSYKSKFLPEIKHHVSKAPTALRCGIARGQVISVGDGQDYVGSCINIASRLQKLSQLTFAISKRGFELNDVPEDARLDLILKKVALAGIGDEELVYIDKSEFGSIEKREQELFKDP